MSWHLFVRVRPFNKPVIAAVSVAGGLWLTAMVLLLIAGLSRWLQVIITVQVASMYWIAYASKDKSAAGAFADFLFRTRCCPGCGFDLVPSPVEADGCTVCPECGAAWKLPYHDDPSKVPGD